MSSRQMMSGKEPPAGGKGAVLLEVGCWTVSKSLLFDTTILPLLTMKWWSLKYHLSFSTADCTRYMAYRLETPIAMAVLA